MNYGEMVWVDCEFTDGAFPKESIYRVEIFHSGSHRMTHQSMAPSHYFKTPTAEVEGRRQAGGLYLTDVKPDGRDGAFVPGRVFARVLRDEDRCILVRFPGGDSCRVGKDKVSVVDGVDEARGADPGGECRRGEGWRMERFLVVPVHGPYAWLEQSPDGVSWLGVSAEVPPQPSWWPSEVGSRDNNKWSWVRVLATTALGERDMMTTDTYPVAKVGRGVFGPEDLWIVVATLWKNPLSDRLKGVYPKVRIGGFKIADFLCGRLEADSRKVGRAEVFAASAFAQAVDPEPCVDCGLPLKPDEARQWI